MQNYLSPHRVTGASCGISACRPFFPAPGRTGQLDRNALPAWSGSWVCRSRPCRYGGAVGRTRALCAVVTSVLVPIFASLYHAGKVAEMRKMLRRNLAINVGICLLLAAPLALFAPAILNWYGPGFNQGVPVLWLTLGATVLSAATSLLSRAMQASGQAWIECVCSGFWAAAAGFVGCFARPIHPLTRPPAWLASMSWPCLRCWGCNGFCFVEHFPQSAPQHPGRLEPPKIPSR